jgi:ribosomal protein S27AE
MTTKSFTAEKNCPNCSASKMKNWRDLTDEQKFLVERLPLNTEFAPEQRKKHRFCERCFFEEIPLQTGNA